MIAVVLRDLALRQKSEISGRFLSGAPRPWRIPALGVHVPHGTVFRAWNRSQLNSSERI